MHNFCLFGGTRGTPRRTREGFGERFELGIQKTFERVFEERCALVFPVVVLQPGIPEEVGDGV